ncbi:hypothetical protein ABZW44_04705 [Streptomyces mirabilis]|jgi:hypothetical protein|uniref:hypothetical protein n=1 Tax=Streptomyces TaxID=1883 RepID=UPI000BCEDCCA|nr:MULTISPECIES: hypothetical protein [Streptomyces]SOE54152.1 hypothetical protein SAMN05446589_0640 [Streptomyces sp. OV198]
MHAIRVASAALLGVSALTLSATAALAGNSDGDSDGGRDSGRDSGRGNNITSFGFNVQPQSIAAGGRLRLTAESCDSVARVSSEVFDTVTIPKGQSSATALIDGDARAGSVYQVTFQCGNESGHTELTIAPGRSGTTYSDPTQVQVPASVQRGVKAGVGGSSGGGFDLKEIGLGTALIAGCVGTAWSMTRRRVTDEES